MSGSQWRLRGWVRGGVVAAVAALSCVSAARKRELIEAYAAADCVTPVLSATDGSAAIRMWRTSVARSKGAPIDLRASESPEGRVVVRDSGTGSVEFIIRQEDYVLPADIRVDRRRKHLYVKQSGRDAVFSTLKTVLVQYDLVSKRETERVPVEPSDLPAECPANETGKG